MALARQLGSGATTVSVNPGQVAYVVEDSDFEDAFGTAVRESVAGSLRIADS